QNEQMVRQADAKQALALLSRAVDEAQAALVGARREMVERELALGHVQGPQTMTLRIELDDLRRSIEGLEYQLHEAIDNKEKSELRAHFEEERRGIRFEVVDKGFEETPTVFGSPVIQLVLVGVAGLLLALPFCTILVGAVDSRVYDGDDIRRL